LRLNRKHISGFVRLLTILGLIGMPSSGWAQANDQIIPRPGWQLLVNSELGYALQYPETSTAVLYQPEQVLHIRLTPETTALVIQVHENSEQLPVQTWILRQFTADQNQRSSNVGEQAQAFQQQQINGVAATSYQQYAFDRLETHTFLAGESRIYEISFPETVGLVGDELTAAATYAEILSSFRLGNYTVSQGFTPVHPETGQAIAEISVPMLNQLDDKWSCTQLGTCKCAKINSICSDTTNLTIGSDGCAITSLAMIFNYYQSRFTAPDSFNACLKDNSSYAAGYCGNCLIRWDTGCKPNGVRYEGTDYSKLDDDLRRGHPVVAKVNGGKHFVVLIGKNDEGNYISNDPWNGVRKTYRKSDIVDIRRYSGTVTNPPPPPNQPPTTPSLNSPSDGHVARDGRAPTLCWNNRGDPDGDQLQFYVEAFDNARSANSGWIGDTCWRPGKLDGNYFNYQWRVKARDVRSSPAESGWSETRHFFIEEPNVKPEISIKAANSNNADSISSREQNWNFIGTAFDKEDRLDRVEFQCSGDNCGSGSDRATRNGNDWSLTRTGMVGQNTIKFRACDEKQCTDSRTVTLRIDLATPTTNAGLSGQRFGDWFNSAVTVNLHADDGATGNARVGVDKIFYRLNNGGWQSGSGQDVTFAVTQDGAQTLEYYAVDKLGNQEATKSISFKIDATKPTPPSNASELNGVVNDQWQKAVGVPSFQWQPGSDATAGLFQHELYFGDKADGADIQKFVLPNEAATWTPLPAGVRTGAWYLRARTRDKANNVSDWVTLFTFRYDNTPPANPASATHGATIANNTWQRTSSAPNFIWPPASDEGSGIQGYRLYWGNDSNGQANNLSNATTYQVATPLCAANQACIGYLRILSVDNVNNEAVAWGTLFTLKYDGLPPTLDLKVNNGVTYTAQTLVTLNLNGVDEHSGLREMRFSHDGVVWTPWEAYATEKIWQIPAIGRQSWPVYAQVRDAVGNESAVNRQEVYFEVNRQQPQSSSYRLFDSLNSAGVGSHTSTSYQGASTVGQVIDSARTSSDNYRITGGYQAGSQAIPLVIPGHDEFTFINGVFASGVVANTLRSPSYAMLATVGEVGLPNNTTTLNSASYQHQPGFLAAVPAATRVVPTPVPTPGPTPPPEPTPDCEFAVASVNNGALFTNTPAVTLNLCAPRVQQMILSNDGGFAGAQWESYARSKPWTITTYGQQVLPRQIYVRYRDEKNVIQTASDDIIYDPTAPSGQLLVNSPIPSQVVAEAANQVQAADADGSFTVAGLTYLRQVNGVALAQPLPLVAPRQGQANTGVVDLYLIAQDDNSGMAQMQLSENTDFTGAAWRSYAGLVEYNPSGDDGIKTLYARFRDSAGNVSMATQAGFVLDSQPPLGGMSAVEEVVGPHALTTTLYLQAEDKLSGVDAMRISTRESFTDAIWRPFVDKVNWPIYPDEGATDIIFYAQLRDRAGNISDALTDTLSIDNIAPLLQGEVEVSHLLTRTLRLLAYDGLHGIGSGPKMLYLSNDPLFIDNVVTLPYTTTVQWTFDERHVVWIKVADSAGNLSEGYPLYAAGIDGPPPPGEQKLYLPVVRR
jgi:hypothetical protein